MLGQMYILTQHDYSDQQSPHWFKDTASVTHSSIVCEKEIKTT